MSKKKKIGFFGGTFDPIHIGHLQLALEAQETFSLDEVLFCPTYLSPFKSAKPPCASAQERLRMVQLAIEGIPGFKVLEDEIIQEKTSYTIDTLRALQEIDPLVQYFLILGKDSVKNFFTWKEAHSLIELAPLLIGERVKGETEGMGLSQEEAYILRQGLFKNHSIEVSSTYLRARLIARLYCKHLIPPKVLDYIREHGLYLTL
jgi:nicotinate-nucleotide adenylyltransferase